MSNYTSILTTKQAIAEANRCHHCKTPACQRGCPISNDISEFLGALGRGDIGEACRIILRKSNLPAICGRVCAHELQCEGHCIRNKNGEGIRIGMCERFIADFSAENEIPLIKIPQKTRGRIGVIGSGPAGLTVAGDLVKEGFDVTVFEAQPEPGGLLMYGIPGFRLPHYVVRNEIRQLETFGVRFVTNCLIGQDTTVDKLFSEGFDALFIGSGTAVSNDLDMPGRDLNGIVLSSYLLRMDALWHSGQVLRSDVPMESGNRVLVVGGGNSAMDTARTAMRLGAAGVTVIIRESEANILALETEYQAAVAEGTQFLFEHSPKEFQGENGQLIALLASSPQDEKLIPCDKVFLAIGSRPANRIVSTTTGIDVNEGGYVICKERPFGMTTRRGVFAGGDVVHKPTNVVLAMRDAKKVAVGIREYVDAVKLLEIS